MKAWAIRCTTATSRETRLRFPSRYLAETSVRRCSTRLPSRSSIPATRQVSPRGWEGCSSPRRICLHCRGTATFYFISVTAQCLPPFRGSYVLASLMFNEFAPGHDLVFGSNATSGWQLEQSLFAPGPQGQDAKAFITRLIDDLAAKRFGANFTVTFCDLWGRAVCRLNSALRM